MEHVFAAAYDLAAMKASELDDCRGVAIKAVEGLSKAQASELLRRWLVSLGACDASIMISLRRLEVDENDNDYQQLQGVGQPGVLSCGNGVSLAYHMHVIDLGPKPPTKIMSKALLEPEIIRVAASLLRERRQEEQKSTI